MIKIGLAQNGATVIVPGEGDRLFVFDKEDLSGLVDMIYTLVEVVHGGGRYDKERIKVSLVHGDKYECTDKECKICKEG